MDAKPRLVKTTDAVVIAIKRELQRGDVRAARDLFQALPDAATHRHQWLDLVFRDLFSNGLIDFATAVQFLNELPDLMSALYGCVLLHRTKAAFESESTRAIVIPIVDLATLVRKLRCELPGRARSQTASYWDAWFRPTTHAIVLGKSVVIESSARREALYAASATYAYDANRRNVFGWRQQWTPKLVHKEQWKIVPVAGMSDRYYVQSVAYNEYLYVDRFHRVGENFGVFTSRVRSTDPATLVGEAGHWQLIRVGAPVNDEYAIYNPHSHTYLSASGDAFDSDRRFLTTATQAAVGATWRPEHTWRVRPQRMTPLEKGIERFFQKQYADAIQHFSMALETSDDSDTCSKLSCLAYRMACHVRLAHDTKALIQEDFDAIHNLGGATATLFYGVYDRWKEGAFALSVALPAIDEPVGGVHSTNVLQSHVERGTQCLIQKEYDRALAEFRAVTTTQLSAYDLERRAIQATAQLRCAKCFVAMGRPEEALVLLDTMIDNSGQLSLEMETHVLLLASRCHRTLRHFDDAIELLQKALDKLSSLPVVLKDGDEATWLRQWVLMELRLVGLFQNTSLDSLLVSNYKSVTKELNNQADETLMPGESESERLVNLFQCPLTLEIMRDPVMTPSGNTYEREMIERHIESVGPWDPLTRRPLTKTQLYPNRTLHALMTTMLCEHRLGRLLAEVD